MARFILVNHHDGEYGVILYLADVKEKKPAQISFKSGSGTGNSVKGPSFWRDPGYERLGDRTIEARQSHSRPWPGAKRVKLAV